MRRTLLFLTALLLVAFAVGAFAWPRLRDQSALTTSYSTAVPHRQTLPLDAYELVSGVLFFRETAARLVASKETHEDRLTALMEWTHENVRPQFAAPARVVPDTFVDIIRRGHGYCDQSAHVFATLAHFAGYRSHLLFLRRPDGRSPHTVAEVLVDDRWVLVDPWLDYLFVNREGRLAGVEDLGVSADLPAGYAPVGIDAGFFQRATRFESFPYQPLPEFASKVWSRIAGAPVARPPDGERTVQRRRTTGRNTAGARDTTSAPGAGRPGSSRARRTPPPAASPGQSSSIDRQTLLRLDEAR
ncbi:MAG: transglutaminase family protein, partial [Vicinamibacterales bacterium]